MLKTIALSLTLAVTTMIGTPAQSADVGDGACCGSTCPHCGCRLVPVCHDYCATKTVTTYKYTCSCEDICIPGITPLCNCGRECCGDRCMIRDVRKLAKYPVTKEVPVRKCTVEWVCPHCDRHGNSPEGAAPSAPVPPSTAAPLPPPAAGKVSVNSSVASICPRG